MHLRRKDNVEKYLGLLLNQYGCRNINIHMDDDQSAQVICGFNSRSSIILKDISNHFKPNKVYKTGDEHFILFFSTQPIVTKLNNAYHIMIGDEHLHCMYSEELDFYHFGYEKDFLSFCKNSKSQTKLSEWGIEWGTTSQTKQVGVEFCTTADGFSYSQPNFETQEYKILAIYDIEKFFQKTCSYTHVHKEERLQRQSFLQGAHSAESPVRNFYDHSNQALKMHLFSFLYQKTEHKPKEDKQKHPDTEINVATFPGMFNAVANQQAISKIQNLVATLHQENKNGKDIIKNAKHYFLRFILRLSRANPSFSLQACMKIAEEQEPHLSLVARKGLFSRTRDLLDTLVPEKIVSVKKGKTSL